MSKKINLSQGKIAIVDDEDFDELNQYRWTYDATGYAHRKIGGRKNSKKIYLHRIVVKAKDGEVVDHENGNRYDCRKENLRIATRSQNAQNQKTRIDNTSGFRGVFYKNESWRRKKWYAKITVNTQVKHLGHYLTAEEANVAYTEAAQEYFGEFRRKVC